jgi:cytochrome c553
MSCESRPEFRKRWRCNLAAPALIFLAAAGCDTGGRPLGELVGAQPDDGTFTSPPLAGPAVMAERTPPPISGGTLLVLADGETAVAADPDRDRIFVADLTQKKLVASIALSTGDEPGRVVEDGAGRVHVVLRRGGAIATLSPGSWVVAQRRPVCATPRGLAVDGELLFVACAEGRVVALPAAGGEALRSFPVERDLRDVVVSGDRLLISRFRAAEVLEINKLDGTLISRKASQGNLDFSTRSGDRSSGSRGDEAIRAGGEPRTVPSVGWRLIGLPRGGAMMVHQEGTDAPLGTDPGGYAGGGCSGPVAASVSTFDPEGSVKRTAEGTARGTVATSPQLALKALPVDLALSRGGSHVAVVSAARDPSFEEGSGQFPNTRASFGGISGNLAVMPLASLAPRPEGGCLFDGGPGVGGSSGAGGAGGSGGGDPPPDDGEPPFEPVEAANQPSGQAVAVAFDGRNRVVVQSRQPAALEILSGDTGRIKLSDETRTDTGHDVFHMAVGSGLACASCHPEGGEDARVWFFDGIGGRRTQSLRGGILKTAPFHWDGDMRNMRHLMTDVFTGRMGGPSLKSDHARALERFVDAIPELPAGFGADPAAAKRGAALFADSKVGCATCHSGTGMTNNTTMDVGTGKSLQVPSLRGLGWRAPYMHDGCARTLADRFNGDCGGGDAHGLTSKLNADQLADLTAYLETL